MKKILIILAIVILVVDVHGQMLRQKKLDDRTLNHYDFPTTIAIINTTDYKKVDTICMVLAYKILGIDTLTLTITYIPELLKSADRKFYGIVQRTKFDNYHFLLLLDEKMSLYRIKKTLSHEFIHIEQFIRGDLETHESYAVYKGDTVIFRDVEYDVRPFEKEAAFRQAKNMRSLKRLLYENPEL